MRNVVGKAATTLTLGTIIAVLAMPANTASLGVGASIGGSGGVNAGAGASVGGGSGVNAGLGASVGGSNGVNAGAAASIGGSNGVDANATASIGGSTGIDAGLGANVGDDINANANANVGNGANASLGLGIGDDADVGVGRFSALSTPSTVAAPQAPATKNAVAEMSGTKLTRMKKRCADVLSSEGTYDADLRALCLMIARR
ncbi:MAG: hypothetical protein E5V81_27555 [Mesorhizobium sp.]|nr:MAG: hypothetical protein E5V81_27555 [Mesorhizobium sp.]